MGISVVERPGFALDDLGDVVFRDSELDRQFGDRELFAPHTSDLVVDLVLATGPEVQVPDVQTVGTVVTGVKDEAISRMSVGEDPQGSRCGDLSSVDAGSVGVDVDALVGVSRVGREFSEQPVLGAGTATNRSVEIGSSINTMSMHLAEPFGMMRAIAAFYRAGAAKLVRAKGCVSVIGRSLRVTTAVPSREVWSLAIGRSAPFSLVPANRPVGTRIIGAEFEKPLVVGSASSFQIDRPVAVLYGASVGGHKPNLPQRNGE